ncbi:MAG TPA: dynamin family protein, partial [Deferrisomatales bacterium]|nr:dynamin family protein [Deferrisomatales bacterium]
MSRAVRKQRDHHARAEFLRAVDQLDGLLAAATGTEVGGRRRQLAELKARLATGLARVAVVGPVKSGKSTLLNALLGEDLLPRGSGVLTAQVTELRRGPHPAVDVEWTSPEDADAEFSRLLTALGHPGRWSLADPEHIARARVAASLPAAPPAAALTAMLDGYSAARAQLGTRQTGLPLAKGGLADWVTRDEVAIFLRGLAVTTPSPRLPAGVALLDCQGYDAWNPWHGAELLAALQQAHAVVYVVSSRVGFRDADQRLLEQLQGLGLLGLTRFVLNVDWGEVRRPGELQRVRDGVQRRIAELGGGDLSQFSALQALAEHLALVSPEALSAGESRLLDAWDADNSGGMAAGRENFDRFRDALWHDAEQERDATVLQRLRADLRGLLVAAARDLRQAGTSGVRRLVWEEDAADRVLGWAQQRIDRAVADCRHRLGQQVREGFGARRAPHRQTWQRLAAAAMAHAGTGAPVEAALGALNSSEPLRVNAV